MEPFLQNVVKNLIKTDINFSDAILVLPNQRAGVYLKKHLKDILQENSFLPDIITFDKFAEQLSGIPKTPAIELLFDFYTVYKKETPQKLLEPFETFVQWAKVILDDINEIDAYLLDPKSIFGTLKEINEIQNWSPDTELTQNYLTFFQKLEVYYNELKKLLASKQKAYQGLLFKEAVKSVHLFIENTDKHVFFIGFNHLTTSEIQIIQELLVADRGKIYFDISKALLKTKAGYFISTYLETWPYFNNPKRKELPESSFNPDAIEIIGVSQNVGMLKYAGELLQKKTVNSEKTALVLADQSVLAIALNTIPKDILSVNITMGIPLKQVPFSDLIKTIFELHSNRGKNEGYYHKNVFKIIQHPTIQSHIKGSDKCYAYLVEQNRAYISYTEIVDSNKVFENSEKEIINNIFKPILDTDIYSILTTISQLINYLKDRVSLYDKEMLYQHYLLIEQLKKLTTRYNYITSIRALFQLYKQLLFSEKISFIGEPLEGLQIMGFLETQAIDFDQLIITSVNEGVLPKGKQAKSFIPFDVRKHFGLPTYQEEDAISSYHFYRLLERTKKAFLLYNSQTDSFGSGEKSRLLTQLIWDFPDIKQKIIHCPVSSALGTLKHINKTPEILSQLKGLCQKGISPSALGLYLYNPLAFYYQKVLGIKEIKGIEETVENNTMGTIIHSALEELYKPFIGKTLTVNALEKTISSIQQSTHAAFQKTYKNGQFKHGKNRLIFEVIVNFITRFIKKELQEVKQGKKIKIIALEKELKASISFQKFDFPITFKGFVDRIDEVNGVLRIVDYKSGKVLSNELKIDDFPKIKTTYKYAKGLQVLLYAYLFKHSKKYNHTGELQAGIISFKNLNSGFIPAHFSKQKNKDSAITNEKLDLFINTIEDLLLEVFDPSIPFVEKE